MAQADTAALRIIAANRNIRGKKMKDKYLNRIENNISFLKQRLKRATEEERVKLENELEQLQEEMMEYIYEQENRL